MTEFILSFLIAFPATYTILTVFRLFKTNRIISMLKREDRYIKSTRRKKIYKIFIKIVILVHPVIGLGLTLGTFCGHGFSEITHYVYVKSAERNLKGRIYYFTTIAG